MRRFKYLEPGPEFEPIEHILTEDDILTHYYPHWCQQMQVTTPDDTSKRECIEDFIIVHWAEELPDV